MAGGLCGEFDRDRSIVHPDFDSLRPVLPAVSVHCLGTGSVGILCGRGNGTHGQGVSQILHRSLHGGRSYCTGLPDLFSLFVQQLSGGGFVLAGCDHGVAVHRAVGI